ncbi:MAG: 30S ribosomal protein S27ae [Candidatus Hodarchaeota archaeon]
MGKKRTVKTKEKVQKVKKKVGPKLYYTFEDGRVKRERIICPRCGNGYFMANHYDRRTCGHCSFTQFLDKEGKIRGGPKTHRRRVRRRTPGATATRAP